MEQNSFSEYDYALAAQAMGNWQAGNAQEIDEYILRKRKEELNRLVKKVIRNELDDKDRLIVHLYWYKNNTKDEIAEKLGVDRSTVFRRFEKINETIYDKLKYAIEYRFGNEFAQSAMLLIKSDVSAKRENGALESIGQRLKRLRLEQYIELSEVSRLTGIAQSRLLLIEKSGKEITMQELKKLATFFRVSSDYIIFGEKRVLRDRETGKPITVAS